MSDKKNEDFVIRMPDSNGFGSEKAPFIGKPPAHRPRASAGYFSSLSAVDNSPGASIMAYCLASISMTVVNKYVVSGKDWNLNFFYLAVQQFVPTVVILLLKQLGMLKNLAPFDVDKAKRWFPIAVLMVGMIYTSTKSLQFLSVPVYTIFKNLTIIAIAYGEVLWFGGSVSPLMLLAFGLMVLSSVVAAWADIQSALAGHGEGAHAVAALSTLNAGYAWMGVNVFCTASFVLGMRKVIKKMNFKDWDSTFYNNLLTIPVLLVCSLVVEDWSVENLARNFPEETRNSLLIGMVYSGLAAIFISYCSAWCIRVTSSTTYSMVGALNKLPLAVAGLVFFAAPVTVGSVSAIALGFISGLIYAWAKVQHTRKTKGGLPTTQPMMSASAQSNKDAANS